LDEAFIQDCIKQRDYEELDLYVMKALVGRG